MEPTEPVPIIAIVGLSNDIVRKYVQIAVGLLG